MTNQYYHIYNRGVDKRDVFMSKKDLDRFVLSVKIFNTIEPVGGLYKISQFDSLKDQKEKGTLVSIVCYCFNPNHFHLILKQEVDGGVSEFLKRLLGGYTKYFNQVHNRSGALFQGRFKSHPIDNDQYFMKIFPYVNGNYLVHDIPQNKLDLVLSSDREYDQMNFNLVSKKEAEEIIDIYGSSKDFKKESINIASLIREQRGKAPLVFLENAD